MGSVDWYHARGGQHVGPVPLEELTRRLGAGEVGSDDLVWREGMPDWQPARAVPELAGTLRADVMSATLPGGSVGNAAAPTAPLPVYPAWPQSPGLGPGAGLRPLDDAGAPLLGYGGYVPPKLGAGGLAITAFVISLVALLGGVMLALPALVMGIIALYNAKGAGRPRGLAVAAVVISGLEILLAGGLFAYLLLHR